jgi:hypothetical protein
MFERAFGRNAVRAPSEFFLRSAGLGLREAKPNGDERRQAVIDSKDEPSQ